MKNKPNHTAIKRLHRKHCVTLKFSFISRCCSVNPKTYSCTLMCGHYKWCTLLPFHAFVVEKEFWIFRKFYNKFYFQDILEIKLTRKRLWNIFTRNLNKYTVIVVFGWLLSKFLMKTRYEILIHGDRLGYGKWTFFVKNRLYSGNFGIFNSVNETWIEIAQIVEL